MIEAFFDGCCEPVNPGGKGGYGIVIKSSGEIVFQLSGYCGDGKTMSNNVAEYEAAGAVMQWLLNNGHEKDEVIVKGDSQLVVKQLKCEWKIKKGLYLKSALRAIQLRNKFTNINFEWIPREQNIEADCLSKIGAELKPQ